MYSSRKVWVWHMSLCVIDVRAVIQHHGQLTELMLVISHFPRLHYYYLLADVPREQPWKPTVLFRCYKRRCNVSNYANIIGRFVNRKANNPQLGFTLRGGQLLVSLPTELPGYLCTGHIKKPQGLVIDPTQISSIGMSLHVAGPALPHLYHI